jgi:hypothetical protein
VPFDGVIGGPRRGIAAPRSRRTAAPGLARTDHPDMPWDATRLRASPTAPTGPRRSDAAAGGQIDRPAEWAADGTLHLISDRAAGGTCIGWSRAATDHSPRWRRIADPA